MDSTKYDPFLGTPRISDETLDKLVTWACYMAGMPDVSPPDWLSQPYWLDAAKAFCELRTRRRL